MGWESRIWEIRPFGSMRGGSAVVIGLGPFNPSAPAYSTLLQIPLVRVPFRREGLAMSATKVTPEMIRRMKGQKIPALTAYDYPMTKLLDEIGLPLILVGDSLGMVVLGYPDTTQVTMSDMEHHIRAAARARPRALLAADLPYQSYDTVESAVANAKRLAAAGAEAV